LKKDEFGIQGYFIPKFNANIKMYPKYSKFFPPPKKRRDFITDFEEMKRFVPPPNAYNVAKGLLIKNKKMKFS
jgi:hypothetical protein